MIEVKNVSYGYHKDKKILEHINLQIEEGKMISVIGKNGSGKSTLGRLLAGIILPKDGMIQIDGLDTKKKENFFEIRKKIGIVFQNPENQIIFQNMEDEIGFCIDNLKLNQKEQRIKEALSQVGLEDKLQEKTYELSLGQKQRLELASVLAVKGKYIVLDEPTSMIDPKGKEEIYEIVRKLKKNGYTIIYITNLIDEILLSDEIIVIENGKITNQFPKDKIIEHTKEIQNSGIKIPEIITILQDLKQKGSKIELQEWTMKELVEKIIEECKHEK